MSRAIEIVLRDSFVRMVGVYVRTFPRAYSHATNGDTEVYEQSFALYTQVIDQFMDETFRAAAAGINKYLNFYMIRATSSVDEFKIIDRKSVV